MVGAHLSDGSIEKNLASFATPEVTKWIQHKFQTNLNDNLAIFIVDFIEMANFTEKIVALNYPLPPQNHHR